MTQKNKAAAAEAAPPADKINWLDEVVEKPADTTAPAGEVVVSVEPSMAAPLLEKTRPGAAADLDDVSFVALSRIRCANKNVRKAGDETAFSELKESIREKGILQSLLLRPVDDANVSFEVVAGSRRFAAATELGLEEVPAIIRAMSDEDVTDVQLVENLQRQDVHPLEEAYGFKTMLERSSVDAVAAKVGKKTAFVYGRLALCDLTPKGRQAYLDGRLTHATALVVARQKHPVLQDKLCDEIAKTSTPMDEHFSPMPLGEAVRRSQNYMLRLSNAPFDVKDESLLDRYAEMEKCGNVGRVRVGQAPACAQCSKSTANLQQTGLFNDVQEDAVCTDADCWVTKKAVERARVVEAATAKGAVVLEDSEAQKILGPSGFVLGSADFIDLDSPCYSDEKQRDWRKVLGKKFVSQVHVAFDEEGFAHDLVKKADAQAAISTAAGGAPVPKGDVVALPTQDSLKDEAKKANEARKLREVVVKRLLADVPEYIAGANSILVLKLLAEALGGAYSLGMGRVVEARGVEGETPETLTNAVSDMSESQIHAFTVQLVLARESLPYTDYSATTKAVCKTLGVDLKMLEKNVAAEKAEKKQKSKARQEAVAKGEAPASPKEKKKAERKQAKKQAVEKAAKKAPAEKDGGDPRTKLKFAKPAKKQKKARK